MSYRDLSNSDRSSQTDRIHEDAGVLSAGTPACDMPTTPRLNGCERKTDSERKTYAQLVEQRHRDAHERQAQMKRWAVEVTEQLHNERSKFMEEFDENDRRIFGLIP